MLSIWRRDLLGHFVGDGRQGGHLYIADLLAHLVLSQSVLVKQSHFVIVTSCIRHVGGLVSRGFLLDLLKLMQLGGYIVPGLIKRFHS